MTVAIRHEHPVTDRLLSPAQRTFWEEIGYVIIPDAVPQENLDAVINAIWEFLQVDRDDPETWYQAPVSRACMLEMYHHQSLWNNRQHPRIYQAFADVWQQEDLWVSIDRANMNPPARMRAVIPTSSWRSVIYCTRTRKTSSSCASSPR